MNDIQEFDEVSGDCVANCGGNSIDGHDEDCVLIEVMEQLSQLKAEREALERIRIAAQNAEYVEETGECVAGCGGDSIGGHTDSCPLAELHQDLFDYEAALAEKGTQ